MPRRAIVKAMQSLNRRPFANGRIEIPTLFRCERTRTGFRKPPGDQFRREIIARGVRKDPPGRKSALSPG